MEKVKYGYEERSRQYNDLKFLQDAIERGELRAAKRMAGELQRQMEALAAALDAAEQAGWGRGG